MPSSVALNGIISVINDQQERAANEEETGLWFVEKVTLLNTTKTFQT